MSTISNANVRATKATGTRAKKRLTRHSLQVTAS